MTHKRLAVHWDTIKTPVENFIARRNLRISHKQEALIKKEMEGYKKWWGLVQVGPFSRDEAILRLKEEKSDWYLNRWERISYTGGSWSDKAEALLKAAILARTDQLTRNGDGRVWLDDDDVRLVRGEIDG